MSDEQPQSHDGKEPRPKRPYQRKSEAEISAAREAKKLRDAVRLAKLRARTEALENRLKTQERKTDTRRKVVAGAIVLETARRDTAFKEQLWKLLDEHVDRPLDRELFGLDAS